MTLSQGAGFASCASPAASRTPGRRVAVGSEGVTPFLWQQEGLACPGNIQTESRRVVPKLLTAGDAPLALTPAPPPETVPPAGPPPPTPRARACKFFRNGDAALRTESLSARLPLPPSPRGPAPGLQPCIPLHLEFSGPDLLPPADDWKASCICSWTNPFAKGREPHFPPWERMPQSVGAALAC